MQAIAQQVFYGLLVELIIVILTVWFKDYPKAAISILAVGTLIAAVVAFYPVQVNSPTENPGSLPSTSSSDDTDRTISGELNCMGTLPGDELKLLYVWTGTEEEKFNTILKPLVDKCGIKIVTDKIATNDQNQILTELDNKVKSSPPDVLFWPGTEIPKQFSSQLYSLEQLGANSSNYANSLRDLGTIDGRWLALPVKLNVKSLVWYSPSQFQAFGYQVPTTFDELNILVDKMASDGKVSWSMGLESGGASGWAGSDFIQDLLLTQQGPEYVMDLISGKVSYDDAGVVQAYQTYAKWASDPKYSIDGGTGTINTNFNDALFSVLDENPSAMMVRQADWVDGEIISKLPGYKYGVDYDFFPFAGLRGLQVGTDNMMVFRDTSATRALVTYLTNASGAAAWAQADLGISPNKLAVGNYSDPRLAKEGEIVARTSAFTPDLGDTIGGSFQQAEWVALIKILQGADIMSELSTVAATR